MKELEEALKLHKNGQIDKAAETYQKLVDQDCKIPEVYQNLGAIQRSKGNLIKAKEVLYQGHLKFPTENGILRNLGNCMLDLGENVIAVSIFRKLLYRLKYDCDVGIQLYRALNNIGLQRLAYAVILDLYSMASEAESNTLIASLIESIVNIAKIDGYDLKYYSELFDTLEKKLDMGSVESSYSSAMILAQLWSHMGCVEKVKYWYKEAEDRVLKKSDAGKLSDKIVLEWTIFSWNTSIFYLKKGDLELGWRLYEYGLQVPAKGKQKWQRSLVKNYSSEELPIWRPDRNFPGAKVLVLGEQGIGDTMMFSLMLQPLSSYGCRIYFYPGKRLTDIYRRSLPMVEVIDEPDNDRHRYDFQIPVGSLTRYLGAKLEAYAGIKSNLKANRSEASILRKKYTNGCERTRLIGISWQGGGRVERIGIKSIKLDAFLPLMNIKDTVYVSLQYGNTSPHVNRFNKKYDQNLICDESINALECMDKWLSQVDAMDGVISIANTTIHGAGGLGIPTLCLLSRQRDWRWIDPERHSKCYWYGCVQTLV